MKIVCLHPALAPYRVDFFNRLSEYAELKLVLLQHNLLNQEFDQSKLLAALRTTPSYAKSMRLGRRTMPMGVLANIRAARPEVVLAYEASPATVLLCATRMFGKFRLWTSMDDAPNMITQRRGMRKWVRDWVLRHVDGVVVPSEAAAEAYRAAIASSRSAPPAFAVVPIVHDTDVMRRKAVDVLAMAAEWRKAHVKPGEKMLLFVGRLTDVKNLPWLLDQVKGIGDGGQGLKGGVRLVLVGDGELRELLEGRIKVEHLENVVLVGRKEGCALYAMMAAADALALCSYSETYGAVVAEALQWGTPVVVSDRVGARVLVNDRNGAVYAHDDADDFREKLMRVLELPQTHDSLLPVNLRDSVAALVEAMHED